MSKKQYQFFYGFLIIHMVVLGGALLKAAQYEYNIQDFGAIGNGKFLNTKAIQKTIDIAEKNGGGNVIVPPGIYISGSIFLKSNITLEIMSGATILGSSDIKDYEPVKWGHNKDRQPYHLIVIKDVSNVSITGGGTIDGNGPAFWKPRDASKDPQWIMAKDEKVSPMVEIENSQDVRMKDVLLLTGGGWTLHLYNSDRIQIQGVKILNHMFAPNGDGIDITGCSDVTVSDCIIKTCDDAICLKSTGDSRECKRVTVTNNILECSCAALKIGNESFRNISQLTITNNVVYGSSRAFALYAGGGGIVEDVIVSNIVCDSKAPLIHNRPIHLSLLERKEKDGSIYASKVMDSDKVYDHEGRQPQLRNIIISNFIIRTGGRILIAAEPGRMIENVTLRDIHMIYPWIEDPVIHIDRSLSSQFSPRNPDAKKARAAFVAENVKNLVLDNLNIAWPVTEEVPESWRFPQKIANGTLDYFYLDYSKARQTEFSAIWGRNLQGGYIRSPLANASDTSRSKIDLQNSTITQYNP